MIVIDTTVLVYAVGVEHPLRDTCRAIIAAVGESRLAATTTVEVLQEFTHVRARRRGRDDAVVLAGRYATLLSPLISVDADDFSRGMRLFTEHESLGAFDAVLAAAVLRHSHLTGLVSADGAFRDINGLRHIDPADPEALNHLGID